MLNNHAEKHKDMGETQNAPNQWTQIVSQIMEKVVSGTTMTTTIEFDNLEVDVPNMIDRLNAVCL